MSDRLSVRRLGAGMGTSILAGLVVLVLAASPGAAVVWQQPEPSGASPSAAPDKKPDKNPDTKKPVPPPPPATSMALPELQLEAARLQADFVRASLDLEQARLNLHVAKAALTVAQADARRAQEKADREAAELTTYLNLLYANGPALDPGVMMLMTGLDQSDGMFPQKVVFQNMTADQAGAVERAFEARVEADRLAGVAEQKQQAADDAELEVQRVLQRIQTRADEVTGAAASSFTSNQQEAEFNDAQLRARNAAARMAWRQYQRRLKRADLIPVPRAVRMSNPKDLPAGLHPVRGQGKGLVPGVATKVHRGQPLTVIPREAMAAVSTAFTALGKPYVAGNQGPETFDCTGLIQTAYPRLGTLGSASALFEQTAVVRTRNVQVGDLVFFANAGAGIHHVGLYVGGNLILAADGTTSQVGVLPLPEQPYAVTRPTLPDAKPHAAPAGNGTQSMSCGAELLTGGATTAGMALPIAEGAFRFSGAFGVPGPMWASGFHTGLDMAAPVGTPVVAAREGVVSVSHPGWAGNLVTVDHGGGLYSRYAHLSSVFVKPGQQVQTGQSIGAVGALGNTTGPHLHFEVLVAGTTVDPMLFLSGGASKTGAGWGGFMNGMIPTTELCGLKAAPGHLLRCDAARAFDALSMAYQAKHGSALCLTDSYRTFAVQVATFAKKPNLAAVPGTSNHGWGLAVDLCGGPDSFGTPEHAWMKEHAPKFGWVHPEWAAQGGSRPEPWHWEFGNVS